MSLKTIIIRHRRENLKKCSLRGLEGREDIHFFTYPKSFPENLTGYFVLSLDGPVLTEADKDLGILLLDGTWRYAEKMFQNLKLPPLTRSLPPHIQTAYPRRQEDCPDQTRGLASVEALYVAYTILGKDTSHLLDHYHFRESFLSKNFDEPFFCNCVK